MVQLVNSLSRTTVLYSYRRLALFPWVRVVRCSSFCCCCKDAKNKNDATTHCHPESEASDKCTQSGGFMLYISHGTARKY